jgi:hypothetical protein
MEVIGQQETVQERTTELNATIARLHPADAVFFPGSLSLLTGLPQ